MNYVVNKTLGQSVSFPKSRNEEEGGQLTRKEEG